MNNNYVNHNRRILNEVASEQHAIWIKERDQRALKRAKQDVLPALNKTTDCLSKIKTMFE